MDNQLTDTDSPTLPGPTTRISLYLRASNLPKSLIAQGYRQPDSLARVSVIAPRKDGGEATVVDSESGAFDGESRSDQETVTDETEVGEC